jgi:hypothetical protein
MDAALAITEKERCTVRAHSFLRCLSQCSRVSEELLP